MFRPSFTSLAAAGLIGGLAAALGGCSSLAVSSNPTTIPSVAPSVTESPTATPTPTKTFTASPTPSVVRSTPTAKPKPTATKTKVQSVQPLFVASLPSTVDAVVGQRIVVQFASDAEDAWTASATGGVTVGGVSFSGPPEEQPDAPGTTIAWVTAKSSGTSTVTLTSGKGASKKLTVRVA
ncbi:MAG: hypothetical protein HQ526_02630 [Actinobacteria bacterium]|nr:hypothetical protein [Actinomycetota bacterium]